jgi:hypothetical protein
VLLVFVAMLGFLGGVPNWHAGWCVGPRYIAVVVPFLTWAITFWARVPRLARAGGPLLGGLVIVSVVLCGVSGAVYPHYPEAFDNPLFDLAFPLLRDGYQPYSFGWLIGLRGAASLLPTALAALAALATGLGSGASDMKDWAGRVFVALFIAAVALLPLSAYGRRPRADEAAATQVVRATWEPPPAPSASR